MKEVLNSAINEQTYVAVKEIVSTLLTIVIIPLITLLGKQLLSYLETKNTERKENHRLEQIQSAMNIVDKIVEDAVNAVMQTYVCKKKENNEFDNTAKEYANKLVHLYFKTNLPKSTECILNEELTEDEIDTLITVKMEKTIYWINSITPIQSADCFGELTVSEIPSPKEHSREVDSNDIS